MDLLDQSQRSLYEKCKCKVKTWEHNFKKINGRLPSKLDIKEADSEVRNAYKTYFQLKTAALEQSFLDVDGFNSEEEQSHSKTHLKDSTNMIQAEHYSNASSTVKTDFTWGHHLNKITSSKKIEESPVPPPTLNLKITRKLSMGSKLIKRNPRKSLSQVKSEPSINSTLPPKDSDSDLSNQSSLSQLDNLKCNLIDPSSSLLELDSLNWKNPNILSSSIKASQPTNIYEKVIHQTNKNDLKFKNVNIEWLERVESSTKLTNESISGITKIDFISDEDIIDNSDDESSMNAFHVAKKMKHNSINISNHTINSHQKCVILTSDSNHSDKMLEEVQVNDTSSPNPRSTLGEQICYPSSHIKSNSATNDENPDNIESQVCSKTEFIQNGNVKREGDVKTTCDEYSDDLNVKCNGNQLREGVVDSTGNEYNDELSVKFKGKNLNENFVRINIKKKVYARGKKTQTFSKYKKKMWRNKKKFLAEGEENVEFRGRFKSDKLLPLETTVFSEDEDLLVTLDQASGNDVSNQISQLNSKSMREEESDEDNIPLALIKSSISASKESEVVTIINNEQMKPNASCSGPTESRKRKIKSKTTTCSKKTEKRVPKSATGSKRNIKNKTINSIESEDGKTRIHFKKPTRQNKFSAGTDKRMENSNNQNVNEHLFEGDEDFDLLLETVRIEQSLNIKGLYPLYSTEVNGSLIDTPDEVYNALRLFGHQSFRDGQERAVMRILSGKSTLVTLSTGSGKSLCYQLPAYLFRQKYQCITLVVSPLISLMEDQIKCIPGVLNAACLHGNQSKTQRDMIIKAVASGEVSILMVSPESILSSENSSGFGSVLARLPPIAFACLDEAHCLSQWSHNFRPSYLVVCRILQETLNVKTILGLTATATKMTRSSLIQQLGIPDGENGVIRDIPVPPNLSLSVSRDANKERALLELLLSEPFVNFKSIIIYCLRRDECEKVATFLRTTLKDHFPNNNSKKRKRMSLQAEPYHAGLSGARRKCIQKSFMLGELRIVVATIAFGMGINKSDLRSVIHFNMPAKFESYVQEIGRAGRDGLPAHCHVFLDRQNADIFELRRHIYGNSVDRHIIRKLLRKVFVSCSCKATCIKHEVLFSMDSTVRALDVPKEIISTLLCYLELHRNEYIKILKPSYANCKILSYGGWALIAQAASNCEPLKLALKMFKNENEENSNKFEFPVLSVARALNHDTGICKRILKNLEWININGQPKRSGLTVELSDLSFHLLSPGNLPDEDLDEVLDSLYKQVLEQENTAYSQLIHINETLAKVSAVSFKEALSDNEEKSENLKEDIREYFESEKSFEKIDIPEISDLDKNVILSDIRSIVSRYSDESFTGRSIARIFHGIASPNFPPYIWGRTKFWRSHLKIHFNTICKIATNELIKLQS